MTCEIRSDNWRTLDYVEVATNSTNAKLLLLVIQNTIGFFLENVGTSGQAKDPDAGYPNGAYGELIYEAEKVVVDKVTGAGIDFTMGDDVYYDAAGATNKVTTVTTANTKCGKALETVGTDAVQVEIDLMVMV
jgi:hypothetical protein